MDRIFCHDDEECRIDRIDAFTQHETLAAALSAVLKEAWRVLERIGRHNGAEGLRRAQRLTVTRIDICHAAFGDGYERHGVHPEHPHRIAEVQATTQHARLETGFTGKREDSSMCERAAQGPHFLHDADTVVR